MFLNRFFNYLLFEKRYSSHTLLSYKNDLHQFSNFIADTYQTSLLEVEMIMIRSWIISLSEQNISPISISRKLSSLKSFYKFLVKENFLEKNPTLLIKSPKVSKKLPEFISSDKLTSLLNAEEVYTADFFGLRDKLVLELLFGCGLRLSELLNLKVNDIYLNDGLLKVLGKRNKERLIPINNTLSGVIVAYLNYSNMQNNLHPYLIVTDKFEQAYPKFIYRLVQGYLSKITTQSKKSPHVLRHSFATSLLNNGADINAIKELLGHANLSATQIYTHNTIERIKTIYKQAHPKA